MTNVLQVENLTVRYGAHVALSGLDMDVRAGEIVGLIGPNGAGKTSFIKALCGRTPDWSGSVMIDGVTLKAGSDRRSLIGLVPQDIGLYPHLTARENLVSFARLMGLSNKAAREQADKALNAVDLTHKAGDRVDTLSGGMKRRINVASAIMHDPKLIILDEPTAGVDIPARDTIHKQARELASSGLAVLLVTHELEQAEAICERILVLLDGKKLAFDAPEIVLTDIFQNMREAVVRFSKVPDEYLAVSLEKFHFRATDIASVWTTMTRDNETDFVSAFMDEIGDQSTSLREITVRQPGLSTLMHYVEKRRAAAC